MTENSTHQSEQSTPKLQKEFRNSASITLTYGDGSTTELNNEVIEGTSTDLNGNFVMEDNSVLNQDLLKSQAVFPSVLASNSSSALPGRARRRGTESGSENNIKGTPTTAAPRRRRKRRSSQESKSSTLQFLSFLFNPHKSSRRSNSSKSKHHKEKHKKKYKHKEVPIYAAIACWYLLGVVSISTTKVLLTPHLPSDNPQTQHWYTIRTVGGIKPFMLSLQQFALGALILRFILKYRLFGGYGITPLPKATGTGERNLAVTEVFLSGLFFSAGFVATNFSFLGSSASFVETVKAAEPITSAAVAVLNGIETLSYSEVVSLIVIVSGVLTSTLANSSLSSASPSLASSMEICAIVMTANICFSCRGLHQKLLRGTQQGTKEEMNDINLQFRMQQIGVLLFSVPAALFEFLPAISKVWALSRSVGLFKSGLVFRYIMLSLINGFAFASYNLASTYILSRISVVHHAALNCIRRIFAIVVTSFLFGIPITILSGLGIALSVCGFLSFTRLKLQRKTQPRPLSSLLPMSTV